MMRAGHWLIVLCFLFPLSLLARIPPVEARGGETGTATSSSIADAKTDSLPVAVPEPGEKAMQYYREGIVLWLAGFVVQDLAFPLLLLFTGWSARLRNRARQIGRNWFFTIVIYFVFFTLIQAVWDFPLSYYQGFVREHAYGMSDQSMAKWMGDHIKSLLVALVTGALVLWVPYLLLKKSPRRWWFYTAALAVPFLAFVILISPVYVAPLFNDFGRMEDRSLEAKILQLADRAGIDGSRVYQVNKSIDTKRINAYVAGLGATKRIVLWDTAIQRLSERELLFVMGHEMGHYVLGHIWKLILFLSGILLVVLFLARLASGWMIERFADRFGFNDLSDVASLPLLLFLFSVLGSVAMPIQLAFSRHLEHEADRFGLEITRDNRAAGTSFSKFVEQNLANPRPGAVVKALRASHPTLAERIKFANDYRPWERGEAQVYDHLFREPKKATHEEEKK